MMQLWRMRKGKEEGKITGRVDMALMVLTSHPQTAYVEGRGYAHVLGSLKRYSS